MTPGRAPSDAANTPTRVQLTTLPANLARFLATYATREALAAAIVGSIGGASSAAVIVVINSVLQETTARGRSMLLWGFIGVCLLRLVAQYTSAVLMVRLHQKIVFELSLDICRRVLATPLRQIEMVTPARLSSALIIDVMDLTDAIVQMPSLCINLTTVLGCLAYLTWLSPSIALLTLVMMVLGLVVYRPIMSIGVRDQHRARQHQDVLHSCFRPIASGSTELKLHAARRLAFVLEALEPAAAAVRTHRVRARRRFAAASAWGGSVLYIVIGGILFVAPLFHDLRIEVLTGSVFIAMHMAGAVAGMAEQVPMLARSSVALGRLRALDTELSAATPERTTAADVTSRNPPLIELVGVTHEYRGEQDAKGFLVGPITVTFKPGEIVFITGGNGSGKTTLAKLITGLYQPLAGELRMNGIPVTDERREQYRQQFSAIFSEFYLFERLFALTTADVDARASRYLTELQLHRKVQVRNGLLSTIDLSTGQRKRLALLTLYLEDRPVCVFDEWAADQDPAFRAFFYGTILPELKRRGKTVLVVTHDDRYYDVADRVIHLSYGKLEPEPTGRVLSARPA